MAGPIAVVFPGTGAPGGVNRSGSHFFCLLVFFRGSPKRAKPSSTTAELTQSPQTPTKPRPPMRLPVFPDAANGTPSRTTSRIPPANSPHGRQNRTKPSPAEGPLPPLAFSGCRLRYAPTLQESRLPKARRMRVATSPHHARSSLYSGTGRSA